ncbi:MAG TPA: hypothetical protein VM124_03510 [Candidatus Limnocylindrales bacterium]|nr:hypothetical protein [Candidatus Limnocylindrales bacterium]
MSVTTPPLAETAVPGEQVSTETLLNPLYREVLLGELLGPDLVFAQQSGLVDMFDYDPATGEDGLMHTLAGVILQGESGEKVVQGFHHEPSGAIAWPTPEGVDAQGRPYLPPTRVDRTHLDSLKAKERRNFRELPYEPYQAVGYVGNVKKLGKAVDAETGETKVAAARSGMYPKEYDALAVLQTIKAAYNNRTQSTPSHDHEGRPVIVAEGYAPMLDGVSLMKVRMILDPETEKIRTAVPLAKPGVMKLSRTAIQEHLGLG